MERPTVAVAAALLIVLHLSGPAAAGQLYDMTPLLYAPHPFEARPEPPPRRSSRPGYAGRLYDMTPLLFAPHPFDVQAPTRNSGQAAKSDAARPARAN